MTMKQIDIIPIISGVSVNQYPASSVEKFLDFMHIL